MLKGTRAPFLMDSWSVYYEVLKQNIYELVMNVTMFLCNLVNQVNTSSGDIVPASFNRSSRCPDELVRRIRVSASFDDPSWRGKLLDTYDTKTDRFIIAPCSWYKTN